MITATKIRIAVIFWAFSSAIGNVKEGRLPETANEIALSEDALQYLGLDAVIGDTVSLDLRVSVMDGSLPELEYSADVIEIFRML